MTQYPYHFYEMLINDVHAWRQEDSANTIALLAEEVGVRPNVAYNWFEWNEDGDSVKTPIPVVKLVDVCNYIGRHNALQVLCEAAGRFLCQAPHVDPQDELGVFARLERLHETTVSLSERLRLAWADQKITHAELNGIVLAATKNQAAGQEIVVWARDMLELGERK